MNAIKNSPAMLDVFGLIAVERLRVRRLQAVGKYKFSTNSPTVSNGLKLAIVMEEIGEVAREIYEMHDKDDFTPQAKNRLRKELVQAAGTLVAWLETPEVKP